MHNGIPFRTFFVAVFLATVALLAAALISLVAHERAMRDLVAERDRRSVALLSVWLEAQMAGEMVVDEDAIGETVANLLPDAADAALFVVDQRGDIVFQHGELHASSTALTEHIGVAEGLRGEHGIAFAPADDGEHIVAYAPVGESGWALIIEEPWQRLLTEGLRATLIAPLTLIPLVLVMLASLWFGGNEIVRPLQQLAQQATALGQGADDALQQPVGGISEVRQLQAQLQSMAQQVARAKRSLRHYAGAVTAGQEEERRRLARELHDGAIQSLTAIHQDVKLAQWENPDGEVGETLARMETQVAALSAELRHIIRGLRPSYLEALGLTTALETLVKHNRAAWSLPIAFVVEGEPVRPDSVTELALYRIAQEALNNVHQHAAASAVDVVLACEAGRVRLTIADDGVGFETLSWDEHAAAGHFGLMGIYERVQLLSGCCAIRSGVGSGTRLDIVLPVNAPATARES